MTLKEAIKHLEESLDKNDNLCGDCRKEHEELLSFLNELNDYRNKVNIVEKANKLIVETSVSEGYLQDWYINSVNEEDDPKWTDKHIAELYNDFYLIPKDDFVMNMSIEYLEFSCRTLLVLKRHNINIVKDLLVYSIYDLMKFKSVGKQTIDDIIDVLRLYNLKLKEN